MGTFIANLLYARNDEALSSLYSMLYSTDKSELFPIELAIKKRNCGQNKKQSNNKQN